MKVESIPHEDDIASYIDEEMDIAGDESYRGEIASQLLQRAQGNFLWVHLAVEKINYCYTKHAVEKALQDLPAGMGALYDRMATAVKTHSNTTDGSLGLSILGWATCSRRALTVDELNDALDNDHILGIHRTIGDLCGGFVVIDVAGNVSLIHETAREFLTRGVAEGEPAIIDTKTTNDALFLSCVGRLTESTLRS